MPHPFRKLLALRRKEPTLEEIKRTSEKLDVMRLTGENGDPFRFDLRDILPHTAPPKLFGYYTASGVEYALTELGVFSLIERQGFKDLRVSLSGDTWLQDMRIHGRAHGETQLVMEGRFRKTAWAVPADTPLKCHCGEEDYSTITIEWFLLQNPIARFTAEKPQLPGQQYPGLGIRDEVMEVFYAVARRLDVDAYLANTMLFNNAFIYSPVFFFLDPRRQAELSAIQIAGQGHSLQDLSLAVDQGYLYQEGSEEPYQWKGATMVRPLSPILQAAYRRSGYTQIVADMAAGMRFRFDWDEFQAARPMILAKLNEEAGRLDPQRRD